MKINRLYKIDNHSQHSSAHGIFNLLKCFLAIIFISLILSYFMYIDSVYADELINEPTMEIKNASDEKKEETPTGGLKLLIMINVVWGVLGATVVGGKDPLFGIFWGIIMGVMQEGLFAFSQEAVEPIFRSIGIMPPHPVETTSIAENCSNLAVQKELNTPLKVSEIDSNGVVPTKSRRYLFGKVVFAAGLFTAMGLNPLLGSLYGLISSVLVDDALDYAIGSSDASVDVNNKLTNKER